MIEKIEISDTEYKGALVKEARYYEPWETYVRRTCYRTVKCGKSTVTIPYDCSYCDHNPPRWTVTNTLGQEYSIDEKEYNHLIDIWKETPKFEELNRSINYHFSCGKDGDAYVIHWNQDPITALTTSWSNSYDNRVQAAHTSFDFVKVSDEDVTKYGLYKYPDMDGFYQETVLGLDSIKWMTFGEKNRMKIMSQYLNGKMGTQKHARIYYLFFADKTPMSANMQEAYWDGGNDNEVVVCIGLSQKTKDIQWVRPFSWSKDRKVIPEVREEVEKVGSFRVDPIVKATEGAIMRDFKRRDFEEFSYVKVDPPTWAIWVTFILTILITFLTCKWAVENNYDNRSPSGNRYYY